MKLSVWRIGSIILLAGLLLVISLAVTITLTLEREQPGMALHWWPSRAEAAARYSGKLLTTPPLDAEQMSKARQLAVMAAAKEPANAAAARNLGLIYSLQGKLREANRAFTYAERMSRRDVPAQMALLELSVQAGNVNKALLHYDRILRTSVSSRPGLIDNLIGAAQDPAIADALIKVLADHPNWRGQFIDALVGKGQDPGEIGRITNAMQLDPADPVQGAQLGKAMRHMVDLGAIPHAYALYQRVRGWTSRTTPLVRGGDFEAAGVLTPFEWQLADGSDRQGIVEARDGASGRFALSLYGDRAGEIARQLLVLAPGKYKLSSLAGDTTANSALPSIAVICASNAQVLTNIKIDAPQRKLINGLFEVPSSCRAQWLFVYVGGTLDPQATAPWIDDLKIQQQ